MTDAKFPLEDTSLYANVFSYMGLPLSRDLDGEACTAVVMGIPMILVPAARAGKRDASNAMRQASCY